MSDQPFEFLEYLSSPRSPPEIVDTPSPVEHDVHAHDYYLRAEICDAFLNYYNIEYMIMYPERCDPASTTPWQGVYCDDDLVDELYHRITCFVEDMIHIDLQKPVEERTVTKDNLIDWMDLIVARSVYEIRQAGHATNCFISDDPYSGYRSLYRRLDDWVQMEASAYNLRTISRPPSPDSTDSGPGSVITQDSAIFAYSV